MLRGMVFSAALHIGLPLVAVLGALLILPDLLHKPPIDVTIVSETADRPAEAEPARISKAPARPVEQPRAPGDTGFAATLAPTPQDGQRTAPPDQPRSPAAPAMPAAAKPSHKPADVAQVPLSVAHRQAVETLRALTPRLEREDRAWRRPGQETEAAALASARYRAAAAAGSIAAQYNLALATLHGRGIAGDVAAAVALLQRAAGRGHIPAMQRLAELLLDGAGAPRDALQAAAWLRLAAGLGDPGATRAAALLLASLPLEEKTAVRQRVLELQAGLSPDRPAAPEKLNGDFLAAVRDDDGPAVAGLLAAGADANAIDPKGRTGLIDAAWRGHASVIELLIGSGADIDATDDDGRTPLIWTAINGHRRTAELLLAYRPEVDRRDRQGLTALMRAAWNGHGQVVGQLLQAGANPTLQDPGGRTAADRARQGRNQPIVDMLARAGAG